MTEINARCRDIKERRKEMKADDKKMGRSRMTLERRLLKAFVGWDKEETKKN